MESGANISFSVYDSGQCDQIGHLLRLLVTNFFTNGTLGDFLAILENTALEEKMS